MGGDVHGAAGDAVFGVAEGGADTDPPSPVPSGGPTGTGTSATSPSSAMGTGGGWPAPAGVIWPHPGSTRTGRRAAAPRRPPAHPPRGPARRPGGRRGACVGVAVDRLVRGDGVPRAAHHGCGSADPLDGGAGRARRRSWARRRPYRWRPGPAAARRAPAATRRIALRALARAAALALVDAADLADRVSGAAVVTVRTAEGRGPTTGLDPARHTRHPRRVSNPSERSTRRSRRPWPGRSPRSWRTPAGQPSAGASRREIELMQYRWSVGVGYPSPSNTCPR